MAKEVKRSDDDKLVEFERSLRIDKNALDEALIEQPELFFKVSDTYALMVSRRDAAKFDLELCEAEVDSVIRLSCRDNVKKTTEKEIEAEKLQHKDVITAHERLVHLNHQVGRWQAMQVSFQQRSYVLKDLVALHLKAYYMENSAGRYDDNRRALADHRERKSR